MIFIVIRCITVLSTQTKGYKVIKRPGQGHIVHVMKPQEYRVDSVVQVQSRDRYHTGREQVAATVSPSGTCIRHFILSYAHAE